MEILLKKSKITNTILNQTVRSLVDDFKNGTALGWCILKKSRYIVIYREDTNSLSKYPLFNTINIKEDFKLEVVLGGNYIPIGYKFTNQDELNRFVKSLDNAKNNALEKGQFFI